MAPRCSKGASVCSEPGEDRSYQQWMTALHTGYQQSALNCWIAALLYLVTLAISGHQLWANHQNQEQFKVPSSALLCFVFSVLGFFFSWDCSLIIPHHCTLHFTSGTINNFVKNCRLDFDSFNL